MLGSSSSTSLPGFLFQDPSSWVSLPRFLLQDSSSRIPPLGFFLQDYSFRIPPSGFLSQDPSSRIPSLDFLLEESSPSIASFNCLGSHAGVINIDSRSISDQPELNSKLIHIYYGQALRMTGRRGIGCILLLNRSVGFKDGMTKIPQRGDTCR